VSPSAWADTPDLFAEPASSKQQLGPGAWLLSGFALPYVSELVELIDTLQRTDAFRNLVTPGGFTMSVAMTNIGTLGWTSDRHGYRYIQTDPHSGQPWPGMPDVFDQLAHDAAAASGFAEFKPDACLVNRYLPGNGMGLHQDKDERDFTAPIVSVSLGLPAVFLFGGDVRSDKTLKIPLVHGDVVVWGGNSRLRYHGVRPLKAGSHALFGARRINLTFRKAG